MVALLTLGYLSLLLKVSAIERKTSFADPDPASSFSQYLWDLVSAVTFSVRTSLFSLFNLPCFTHHDFFVFLPRICHSQALFILIYLVFCLSLNPSSPTRRNVPWDDVFLACFLLCLEYLIENRHSCTVLSQALREAPRLCDSVSCDAGLLHVPWISPLLYLLLSVLVVSVGNKHCWLLSVNCVSEFHISYISKNKDL